MTHLTSSNAAIYVTIHARLNKIYFNFVYRNKTKPYPIISLEGNNPVVQIFVHLYQFPLQCPKGQSRGIKTTVWHLSKKLILKKLLISILRTTKTTFHRKAGKQVTFGFIHQCGLGSDGQNLLAVPYRYCPLIDKHASYSIVKPQMIT